MVAAQTSRCHPPFDAYPYFARRSFEANVGQYKQENCLESGLDIVESYASGRSLCRVCLLVNSRLYCGHPHLPFERVVMLINGAIFHISTCTAYGGEKLLQRQRREVQMGQKVGKSKCRCADQQFSSQNNHYCNRASCALRILWHPSIEPNANYHSRCIYTKPDSMNSAEQTFIVG